MVKIVLSPYSLPGIPPNQRTARIRAQAEAKQRLEYAKAIRELVLRVTHISEMELTSYAKKGPHRTSLARMFMTHYMYYDAQCTLKEIASVIRPKNPLNHATIIYYNKVFRNLQASKDEQWEEYAEAFLKEYPKIQDSFTTNNPTQ